MDGYIDKGVMVNGSVRGSLEDSELHKAGNVPGVDRGIKSSISKLLMRDDNIPHCVVRNTMCREK